MNDVEVIVGGDTSPAQQALAGLRSYGQQVSQDLSGAFARGIAVGAIVEGLRAVIEKAHEIHHEAERFGLDAQQLQLIANAAKEDGISMETVARAMNMVEIAGAKALEGENAQSKALERLGLEAQSFNALNPSEKILALSDAWNKSSKSGEDYAAVAKLVGARFGTELIPLLNLGSESIKRVSEEMGIMGTCTVNAGENMHRQWESLKNDLTNLGAVFFFVYAAWLTGWRVMAESFIISKDSIVAGFHIIERAAHFDWPGIKKEWDTGLANMAKDLETFKQLTEKSFGGGEEKKPGGTGAGASPFGESVGGSGGDSGGGGGGGGASNESLQARIDKLREEHMRRQLSDQDKLNRLVAQSTPLYLAQASAVGDETKEKQAQLAYLENQKEIDTLTAKIAKEKLDTEDQITKARQTAAADASRALADSQEANKEIGLELEGRKDLAERSKIQYDYDQKIAQAQEAVYEAEAQGFTEVAKTNQALVSQLSLEKQNALAAHDQARAEEEAAEAAQKHARALAAQKEVGSAQANLEQLQEYRREQELIVEGHGEQARLMHEQFEWQQKIDDATAAANDAWQKMDQAFAENNVEAGDFYAELGKINEATAKELELQKQISGEIKGQAENQRNWEQGMQNFANNAGGAIAAIQSSPAYQKLAEKYGPAQALQNFFPNASAVTLATNPYTGTVDQDKLAMYMKLIGDKPVGGTLAQQVKAQEALILQNHSRWGQPFGGGVPWGGVPYTDTSARTGENPQDTLADMLGELQGIKKNTAANPASSTPAAILSGSPSTNSQLASLLRQLLGQIGG